jgi:hypothetical protein
LPDLAGHDHCLRNLTFVLAPCLLLVQAPSATSLSLISAEETENIIIKASDCAEGECSVDEVSDLIDVLRSQQKELSMRVEEVDKMIKSLKNVNSQDVREVDEVRETVRALFRVFQLGAKASNNDYPSLSKPMGYSGEVGKGPTTAYDALAPKKWKPSP